MCWEACASACFTLQLQPLLTIQEHKDVMPGFFPFFSRFSFHCPQKGTLTVEIIATQISNNSIKICQCANIQIYSQGKAAALRAQVNGCALLHVREATRLLWHLQGSNKFWFLEQTPPIILSESNLLMSNLIQFSLFLQNANRRQTAS